MHLITLMYVKSISTGTRKAMKCVYTHARARAHTDKLIKDPIRIRESPTHWYSTQNRKKGLHLSNVCILKKKKWELRYANRSIATAVENMHLWIILKSRQVRWLKDQDFVVILCVCACMLLLWLKKGKVKKHSLLLQIGGASTSS